MLAGRMAAQQASPTSRKPNASGFLSRKDLQATVKQKPVLLRPDASAKVTIDRMSNPAVSHLASKPGNVPKVSVAFRQAAAHACCLCLQVLADLAILSQARRGVEGDGEGEEEQVCYYNQIPLCSSHALPGAHVAGWQLVMRASL